jgi:hypothetical protein
MRRDDFTPISYNSLIFNKRKVQYYILRDIAKYREYVFFRKKDYIDKYRRNHANRPFYAFSMIFCSYITGMHAATTYIV